MMLFMPRVRRVTGCKYHILVHDIFPENLVSMYLAEGTAEADAVKTLGFGKEYLFVMLIGLLPFAFSPIICEISHIDILPRNV